MSDVFNFGQVRVSDANGDPIPGALATFYIAGTNTLAPIKNAAGAALANPQTADAGGVFSQLVYADTALKVNVTTAAGAAVPGYPMDLAFRSAGTTAAASAISFSPTVALPYTNVQAAIEASAASAASGFQAFGLGVTGTNAALSDLDATGTGSGVYRFTASTTGTFPTGVVATDTGVVELWREDAGSARMFIMPDNSDRIFTRRMTASAWGAWLEIIHVAQGAADGDLIYRASGAWSRLAKGTAGQQLRMNSGATAPEWVTGGRDTIFSTTVSSAVAAIDITTFDVAKYSHYQIFLQGLKPVTAAQLLMRLSTDGGATFISTTAAYIDQYTILTNGGQSQAYGNSTAIAVRGGGNVNPTYGIDGMIDLFGLGESGRTVAIRQIRTVDNADNGIYEHGNGARVLDEAHNAIRFFFSTGNIASGSIIVEGIRR